MSVSVSLGIIFFSALICALFQLSLGTLLLLYHSSLGRFVKKKTKSLASSFISGVCLMSFLLLASSVFLDFALFGSPLPKFVLCVFVGILVALALIIWFLYFRPGKLKKDSTELWLPKKISRFINSRARITNDNSEAFSLGLLTVLGELPFTFILFLLSGASILELPESLEVLALVVFAVFSVLPLIILRFAIRKGKTVVEVQRFRVRNKFFFKILTGFCFLILAAFIFAFKFFGGSL